MVHLDLRLSAVKPRVAIVGAGWAGLAAAVELAPYVELTVFEASREPGGRARRVLSSGQAIDNGQHILLGAYQTCGQLMRRVGIDPELMLLRMPLTWFQVDGLAIECPSLPAPWHLVAGLIAARGLSWRDKGQLLRALWQLRLTGWRIEGDLTVTAWLRAQRQGEVLQRLFWRPLVCSALNTPAESASMRVLAAVLRDSLGAARAASDMMLPRCDLSALFPNPAVAWIAEKGANVRLGHRVRAVHPVENGVLIDDQPFDAAIVACAPEHLRHLLPRAILPSVVQSLSFWPICTVYLRFARPPHLPVPMMGLCHGMVNWLFDRDALCGEMGMLAAVISAPASKALPDDKVALIAAVLSDVRRIVPGLSAPDGAWVVRVRRATFAATPGRLPPDRRLAVPCLFLAGDWVDGEYPATLEGAVRSGTVAAQALLREVF